MTFRLDTPEGVEAARSWDFFVDGERADSDPRRHIATVLTDPYAEPLVPSRTFAYHESEWRAHGGMGVEEVDSYRCWPDAGEQPNLERVLARDGGFRIPLVIYTNGERAVLGDGNHRLAAAKRVGLTYLPVFIAPDRLELPKGMTHDHLAPMGDLLPNLFAAVVRVHDFHPSKRRLIEHGVAHVWCSCGASWKRNA